MANYAYESWFVYEVGFSSDDIEYRDVLVKWFQNEWLPFILGSKLFSTYEIRFEKRNIFETVIAIHIKGTTKTIQMYQEGHYRDVVIDKFLEKWKKDIRTTKITVVGYESIVLPLKKIKEKNIVIERVRGSDVPKNTFRVREVDTSKIMKRKAAAR